MKMPISAGAYYILNSYIYIYKVFFKLLSFLINSSGLFILITYLCLGLLLAVYVSKYITYFNEILKNLVLFTFLFIPGHT